MKTQIITMLKEISRLIMNYRKYLLKVIDQKGYVIKLKCLDNFLAITALNKRFFEMDYEYLFDASDHILIFICL